MSCQYQPVGVLVAVISSVATLTRSSRAVWPWSAIRMLRNSAWSSLGLSVMILFRRRAKIVCVARSRGTISSLGRYLMSVVANAAVSIILMMSSVWLVSFLSSSCWMMSFRNSFQWLMVAFVGGSSSLTLRVDRSWAGAWSVGAWSVGAWLFGTWSVTKFWFWGS